MSFFDSEGVLEAVEGGGEFVAMQQALVAYLLAVESARREALPVEPLPQGTFESLEEAEAYLAEARAAGKFPQRFDDGSGNYPFILEVSSPYKGYENVWITAVSDTDPNPPLEAVMGPG